MNNFFKNKYVLLALTLSVILIGTGVSYSLFSEVLEGEKDYVINVGDLKFTLDESSTLENVIQEGSLPISDVEGRKLPGYNFSLINDSVTDIAYTIYIVEDTPENKTPSNDIKLYYVRDNENVYELRYLSETNNNDKKVLESGVIPKGETFNYNLKMWIASTAGNEVLGTSYSCHLEVEATQYIPDIYADNSGASYPELKGDLVPIVISDTGSVTKADLTKEWYDYNKSEWANAVILNDGYGPYNNNETIPEEAIESYFVWIPRYRYKIFDDGLYSTLTAKENAEQEIEIEFESKSFITSNGTQAGTWLTHPAFTSFDTDGFWVGKFESGYKGATSTATAQVDSGDSANLVIKPNQYSWRNITVGNSFKVSYDYQRDLDSHMMKNTEWGAVAYLSHSKYGHIGSVRVNNNINYVTGYAATEEPTVGYKGSDIAGNRIEATSPGTDGTYTVNYYNATSVVASTTGNYSGVYDMSGGAWDYVMGNTNNTIGSSGITSVASDFYTNSLWTKYYDKYPNQTSYTVFNNRILGDATGEMGPFFSQSDPDGGTRNKASWYGDNAYFAYSSNPWFVRGGAYNHGAGSGAFAFYNYAGGVDVNASFRVVLAP